jgi:hypothetical protein
MDGTAYFNRVPISLSVAQHASRVADPGQDKSTSFKLLAMFWIVPYLLNWPSLGQIRNPELWIWIRIFTGTPEKNVHY